MSWSDYYAASQSKPLHPILELAEPHLPQDGLAYDLGCGIGDSTRWLLDHGFQVIAVDAEQEACDQVQERLGERPELVVLQQPMESLEFKPCTVVLALFCVFFIEPDRFPSFWEHMTGAIEPGGVFIGQILGVRDEWTARGYSAFEREEVQRMFSGFDLIEFDEVEKDGYTLMGDAKHWHVFHIIAKKR